MSITECSLGITQWCAMELLLGFRHNCMLVSENQSFRGTGQCHCDSCGCGLEREISISRIATISSRTLTSLKSRAGKMRPNRCISTQSRRTLWGITDSLAADLTLWTDDLGVFRMEFFAPEILPVVSGWFKHSRFLHQFGKVVLNDELVIFPDLSETNRQMHY